MLFTIPMLCHARGQSFPSIAKVHANDEATAKLIAATQARLEGADRIDWVTNARTLSLKHRQWFAKNRIY